MTADAADTLGRIAASSRSASRRSSPSAARCRCLLTPCGLPSFDGIAKIVTCTP